MKEKRASKRYEPTYFVEAKGENESTLVSLKNMCRDGLSFDSKNDFLKEQELSLRVFLKTKMFLVQASVVYVKKIDQNIRNVGAKFTKAPQGFSEVLEKELEEIKALEKEMALEGKKNSFRIASDEYQKRKVFQ